MRRKPRVFAPLANGLIREIDAMQERIDAVAEEEERLWKAMQQLRSDD